VRVTYYQVTDESALIAWGPRIASLDLAFGIRGMYKKEQEKTTPNIKIRRNVVEQETVAIR
jgi:hypothetical protein